MSSVILKVTEIINRIHFTLKIKMGNRIYLVNGIMQRSDRSVQVVGRGFQVVGRGSQVVGRGFQVVGRWFQVVGRGLLIGRDLH